MKAKVAVLFNIILIIATCIGTTVRAQSSDMLDNQEYPARDKKIRHRRHRKFDTRHVGFRSRYAFITKTPRKNYHQ